MELSKQEMELLLQLPSCWSKHFYFQIMNKVREDGVNMQEGKLVSYKSFVIANECNTGQIVFLNQNIPRGVSYYLEQLRAELRWEFLGINTHPHSTLITQRECSKFRQDRSWRIRTCQSQQENIVKTMGVWPHLNKHSWKTNNT